MTSSSHGQTVIPAGSRLTIDPLAIARNWRRVKDQLTPGTQCAAAVKADAYGCGLAVTVKHLAEAGCSTFFVATPQEGVTARQAAPGAVIYILNGLFPGAAPLLAEARLRPVLGSLPEIEEWALFCRERKVKLEAAIHINTGMNRLGLNAPECERLAADGTLLEAFTPSLLMSHLACAAEPAHPMNKAQLAAFEAMSAYFPGVPRSLANSAGVFLGPEFHFDLVRPGIALYGGQIIDHPPLKLEPVIRLEARVLQVRKVPAGEGVGYGLARTAERDSRIAMLSCGYGDGFLRGAGSADGKPGASAWVDGHALPLFGRISMDMLAVDATDVPADKLRRGTYVELLGPNASLQAAASAAGTIDYELLTGLGSRHARIHGPLDGGTTGD